VKRRNFQGVVIALLAVVLGLAAFLIFAPSDQYLFVPDKARPVDPLIRVEGEKPATSDEDGGVYMVDILIRKASRLEALFPSIASDGTLVPADALNPAGVSEADRRQEGKNQMSRSQEIAAAVALEHLGYDIDVKGEGAQIDTIVPGRPAEGVLEVGDVIVEAGGEPVKGHADLVKALGEIEPGDDIDLVVLRDGKRTPVTVGTSESPEDPDQAVMGVIVADAATFDLPVDVSIDAGSIGGPSAGLAFALGIVDELGDDIDRGRTVVVTGELALDGTVIPIGGIKQKTIGAKEAGADVFIVPDANAEEARKYADGLEIVAVSNFDEAIDALAKQ
jgi:Lon-like protease